MLETSVRGSGSIATIGVESPRWFTVQRAGTHFHNLRRPIVSDHGRIGLGIWRIEISVFNVDSVAQGVQPLFVFHFLENLGVLSPPTTEELALLFVIESKSYIGQIDAWVEQIFLSIFWNINGTYVLICISSQPKIVTVAISMRNAGIVDS